VFDNVDDPDQLRPYLLGEDGGDIIITSRNPEIRRYGTVGCLQVGPLSLADYTSLFIKFAWTYGTTLSLQDIRSIAEALYYQPLPITITKANQYIYAVSCFLQEYVGILEREKSEVFDEAELASVHSLESRISIATGSSTMLVGEVMAAANEFVNLLLRHPILPPLLSAASVRIEADKFERNIKRLLKAYAVDLQQEARGDVEKEAVRLILRRARYIAHQIRLHYDESAGDKVVSFEQVTKISIGAILEDYLRDKTGRIAQTPETKSYGYDDNDGDVSTLSISSEGEADQPEVSDLDLVKLFMLESAAYERFRQNLKSFVLPRRELEQQTSTGPGLPTFFSLETWHRLQVKSAEIIQGVRMLSRPLVRPGHKRITWICVSQILQDTALYLLISLCQGLWRTQICGCTREQSGRSCEVSGAFTEVRCYNEHKWHWCCSDPLTTSNPNRSPRQLASRSWILKHTTAWRFPSNKPRSVEQCNTLSRGAVRPANGL
jgi:hypothetical protein